MRPTRFPTTLLLLIALSPLALDGCVSVGLSRSALEPPPGPGTGTVEVAVYRKEADRDASQPVPYKLFSTLRRVDGPAAPVVARSMASTWSLAGLPAGRYRLEITKRIDERGNIEPLESPVRKELEVTAGEKTQVIIVLEKVPVVWIVLAALTVVLLVILGIHWAKEGKLPPLPPLPPPLPFPVVVTDFTFGAFGAFGGPREGVAGSLQEPAVADVFPASNSVVTEMRVTTSFLITCPLGASGPEPGAILALGTLSGDIEGETAWYPDEQLLTFTPAADFAPGEKVTVTLDLEKLQGSSGRHGSGKASTTFKVSAAGR